LIENHIFGHVDVFDRNAIRPSTFSDGKRASAKRYRPSKKKGMQAYFSRENWRNMPALSVPKSL
jgi:hypothetical protein